MYEFLSNVKSACLLCKMVYYNLSYGIFNYLRQCFWIYSLMNSLKEISLYNVL